MTGQTYNLIVLLGATAGGKTALAVKAAQKYNAEIISADSRQVYRGMDLGTGKDLEEYGDVPCHLIDISEPGSEYNLFQFQRDCFKVIEALWTTAKIPLICGGTGLYLDAVLRGYRLVEVAENSALRRELSGLSDVEIAHRLRKLKPDQHNSTDLAQRGRMIKALEIAVGEQAVQKDLPPLADIRPVVFGLQWPRAVLRQRITQRLQQRFELGMIEEVQQLHDSGVSWEQLEFYGLEYRLIAQHLQGQLSRNDMVQKLRSAIGQFAKRQDTFFRRMEKKGVDIHWLDAQADAFGQLCEWLDEMTFTCTETPVDRASAKAATK